MALENRNVCFRNAHVMRKHHILIWCCHLNHQLICIYWIPLRCSVLFRILNSGMVQYRFWHRLDWLIKMDVASFYAKFLPFAKVRKISRQYFIRIEMGWKCSIIFFNCGNIYNTVYHSQARITPLQVHITIPHPSPKASAVLNHSTLYLLHSLYPPNCVASFP